MGPEAKTKEQLLAELSELRERVAELEAERLERKKADEAPCPSKDQFRAIYEQAPLGIALLDSQTGQFLNVNYRYAEIAGLTPAEMLQLDFQSITHPDDLEADLSNMARLRAGEIRFFQMEKRYVRPGGAIVWVRLSVAPMWLEGESPTCHLAMVEDITDRKRVEDALRESENKNRFLADLIRLSSQPVGVGYPDGRFGLVNNAFEQLVGYGMEELQSIDWTRDLTPGEWRPMEQLKLEELHRTQKPVRYEKEYIRKDGARVPVELLVHLVTDADGKPKYYYSYVTDITERKKAEEHLRKSEERYRSLFEQSLDGILLTAPDGRIFRANPAACEMLGRSELEICEGGRECVVDTSDPRLSSALEERIKAGRFTGELRYRRGDSTPFTVELSSSSLSSEEGEARSHIIFRDISDRKQVEEKLTASEEKYRTLFENMNEIVAVDELIYDSNGQAVDWRILDVNPAYLRGSGKAREDIIDRCFSEIHGIEQALEPAISRFAQVVKTGEPVRFEQYFEPLGIHMLISAFHLGGARFATASIDVSEQKQTEHALVESKQFLRAALDGLAAHIAILDEDGTILLVNSSWRDFAETNGLPAEKVSEGTNYLHVCASVEGQEKDDATLFGDGIRRVLSGATESYSLEYPCHSPTDKRWFLGRVTPFPGDSPKRVVIAHHDITGRKHTEEAIRVQSEQLRALARRLAEVEEIERQKLARELHDQIGQNLSALGVNITLLKVLVPGGAREERLLGCLDDSGVLLEQTIALVRDLMVDLRPPGLDEYGLLEALRWYAANFSRRTGIAVEIVGEEPIQRLQPLQEIALFRIAQEALRNVLKHARATRVTLTHEKEGGLVRLIIADNGVGFDPTSQKPGAFRGWGILIMQERALGAGGKCRIESQPGRGARVLVEAAR